jgi:hypothetical protein
LTGCSEGLAALAIVKFMILMNVSIETKDDCFEDMTKLKYGSRVLIKVADDESCEDPQFGGLCEQLMKEDKVIIEETCSSASCNGVRDDPFVPCFGCDNATPRSSFDKRNGFKGGYQDEDYEFHDRQSGETFRATRQSRRIICPRGATSSRRCRLRASRVIQFRNLTYFRALSFVQSEQYLSSDDIQIIRFFQTLFN